MCVWCIPVFSQIKYLNYFEYSKLDYGLILIVGVQIKIFYKHMV